jgi:hypothetical protein
MMCPVLREECLKSGCEWFIGDGCAIVKIASNTYLIAEIPNPLSPYAKM